MWFEGFNWPVSSNSKEVTQKKTSAYSWTPYSWTPWTFPSIPPPQKKNLPQTTTCGMLRVFLGPSLSRLRARELISRHRIIDHPPIHAGTSSDPEDKYTVADTADYSGDTDEYTVPSSLVIKPEPIEDNLTKHPTSTDDLIINKSTKTSGNSSKSKQKQKPTKSAKNQNTAPSILKLKKGSSKGEWQIKRYARVKYRKTRSHQCPVNSCKF